MLWWIFISRRDAEMQRIKPQKLFRVISCISWFHHNKPLRVSESPLPPRFAEGLKCSSALIPLRVALSPGAADGREKKWKLTKLLLIALNLLNLI
jgi:hypothetical protein